jgi:indole-3-glycerol phosphate synthase
MNILEKIIRYKRDQELLLQKQALPLPDVQAKAAAAAPALDFVAGLTAGSGMGLIAEIKKASPSKGLLCPNFDALQLASAYAGGGASALSVLTDEHYFQGSLGYLTQIRAVFPKLPLLRKDFIFDPYQIYQSRAAGADALLLIAAVLPDNLLAALLDLTCALGMEALIEIHNHAELRRVLPLEPRLLGVNNRNLETFQVDLNTSLDLRPLVPADICFVAESGIRSSADLQALSAAGVNAVLIGEALVTAADVKSKVREIVDGCQG